MDRHARPNGAAGGAAADGAAAGSLAQSTISPRGGLTSCERWQLMLQRSHRPPMNGCDGRPAQAPAREAPEGFETLSDDLVMRAFLRAPFSAFLRRSRIGQSWNPFGPKSHNL